MDVSHGPQDAFCGSTYLLPSEAQTIEASFAFAGAQAFLN
jgi:hypothetical protein